MVRQVDAQRRMPWAAVAVFAALGLGGAGCGSDDEFAGTIELIASNQTTTSQRVTLRSRGRPSGGEQLEQSTGPINPGDTASLKADLSPGRYLVTADSEAIAPATIVVGAARENAEDGLLQP
jgi:hypothetical protein